jgi:hypothetical protein
MVMARSLQRLVALGQSGTGACQIGVDLSGLSWYETLQVQGVSITVFLAQKAPAERARKGFFQFSGGFFVGSVYYEST